MTRALFMQSSDDPLALFKNPGSNAGQVLLLIGLVVVMAVVIFIWAAYVRTPKKTRHSHHHSDHDHSGLPERRRRRSGLGRLFGRKHRRRRSSSRERPVNPTLSQIGGLPPRRDEQHPRS